jgi:nitrate/nitrite transporter NarK
MPSEQANSPKKQQRLVAALPTFWTLLTGFLTGSDAAGSIALINSIGNLGGFVGPYAIGWIKDATGEIALGLVMLAACSIMAGVVTFLMGHDCEPKRCSTELQRCWLQPGA